MSLNGHAARLSEQSPDNADSLSSLNKQCQDCLMQLNTIRCLELELNLEDARIGELKELYDALKQVRDNAEYELVRQLDAFNDQYGSAPRDYFALMYRRITEEIPGVEPDIWIISPPFAPLDTSVSHIKVSKWNHYITVGYCMLRRHIHWYYYRPRLHRSHALKELARLKERLEVKQGMERALQLKLHQYKLEKEQLHNQILQTRHELANPSEICDSVPAFRKYARAAQLCFLDMRRSAAVETLPRLSSSNAESLRSRSGSAFPQTTVGVPTTMFKSFLEHHGVPLESDTWDSGGASESNFRIQSGKSHQEPYSQDSRPQHAHLEDDVLQPDAPQQQLSALQFKVQRDSPLSQQENQTPTSNVQPEEVSLYSPYSQITDLHAKV